MTLSYKKYELFPNIVVCRKCTEWVFFDFWEDFDEKYMDVTSLSVEIRFIRLSLLKKFHKSILKLLQIDNLT